MQGKLFLATLFTIGGGADRPYLWIKSDGAQYEIVLTEKTSLPSDWRQKRDGDDTQYPVTLIGVGGTSTQNRTARQCKGVSRQAPLALTSALFAISNSVSSQWPAPAEYVNPCTRTWGRRFRLPTDFFHS